MTALEGKRRMHRKYNEGAAEGRGACHKRK